MKSTLFVLLASVFIVLGIQFALKAEKPIHSTHQNTLMPEQLNEPDSSAYSDAPFQAFMVQPYYSKAVYMKQLSSPRYLKDLVSDYPVNWIQNYRAVNVSLIKGETEVIKTGKNDLLTKEQAQLIKTAQIGDEIKVTVDYMRENTITKAEEIRQLNVLMTVIPAVEAEYIGGNMALRNYLIEHCPEEISEQDFNKINLSLVFTINENGRADNINVEDSNTDASTNQAIIELISSMPQWKPARTIDGKPVQQKFQLFVGGVMGC